MLRAPRASARMDSPGWSHLLFSSFSRPRDGEALPAWSGQSSSDDSVGLGRKDRETRGPSQQHEGPSLSAPGDACPPASAPGLRAGALPRGTRLSVPRGQGKRLGRWPGSGRAEAPHPAGGRGSALNTSTSGPGLQAPHEDTQWLLAPRTKTAEPGQCRPEVSLCSVVRAGAGLTLDGVV